MSGRKEELPEAMGGLSLNSEHELTQPLVPPETSIPGIIPIDITQKFRKASQALSPGDIVKDGFFSLFDAVSALEIMDPKMDSGCTAQGEDFDELYDVSSHLKPEQVVGIIDQLLCHEMAWHIGYPLSQTLFTSVYIESLLMPPPSTIYEAQFIRNHNPTETVDPMLEVLRAYCLGLLKACDCVNERIKGEHNYEEEDFVTNTYQREMLIDIPSSDIYETLIQAELLVRHSIGGIDTSMVEALGSRLELRRHFLRAAENQESLREIERLKEPWKAGIALLSQIDSSHHLAEAVDSAFSAKLQRQLASTMPPRPIVNLSFTDAFGHLTRLLADGLEVVNVLNYSDSQSLQKFVWAFQSKKPQPLVYIRTFLQMYLFSDMEVLGSMSIRQLLDDDMRLFSLPTSVLLDPRNDDVEAVFDPRFIIANQMEIFRKKAAQPFLDILRAVCQNRCRIRRILCHVVQSWENLLLDAEEIDSIIRQKVEDLGSKPRPSEPNATKDVYSPLASWVMLYKLQQMEWIVQLGFELEIYQADELGGMYLWLSDLAKDRLRHCRHVDNFISEQYDARKLTAQQLIEKSQSFSFHQHALLEASSVCMLAGALSTLYAALGRLELVKPPPRPYGQDVLRYELRMKPFPQSTPPLVPPFDQFQYSANNSDLEVDAILSEAEFLQGSAKEVLDRLSKSSAEKSFSVGSHQQWLVTVKNAQKSCIATGIAIAAIRKAWERKQQGEELGVEVEIPTPSKAYHEWWIVPKVMNTLEQRPGTA